LNANVNGQKGLVFVITILLLRWLNIKFFYSSFILIKISIFFIVTKKLFVTKIDK
jgi:hypothetical protein